MKASTRAHVRTHIWTDKSLQEWKPYFLWHPARVMVSGKVKWKWLTTIERRFLPPAEPDLTDFYVQYRLQGNAEHVTYEVESPDFSFGPIM